MAETQSPKVGLFATCLVDLFRPSVGIAAAKLLEDAGCEVHVPRAQTCCGQPAYNSGDRQDAKELAKQAIELFEGFDHVVVPSGSCAAMLKMHYPALFKGDAHWEERCLRFSDKVFELASYLTDIRGMTAVAARLDKTVTYHDSCSGLRQLGISQQPRQLLASIEGLQLTEMAGADVCCGFGGSACGKNPDISGKTAPKKTATITETGADMLLAGDMGCLMHLAGRLKREGASIEVRHVAEVLAGMTDNRPIAGGR